MRLDGDLVRVGPSDRARYTPVDRPLDVDDRAALIADDVPTGFIAAGTTAAWVYDGLCPGDRLQFVSASRRRAPQRRRFVIDVRHAHLRPGDTWHLRALHLTTPARTLIDLAVDESCSDDRIAALVATLRSNGAAPTVEQLQDALRFRKGSVAARMRLDLLLAPVSS